MQWKYLRTVAVFINFLLNLSFLLGGRLLQPRRSAASQHQQIPTWTHRLQNPEYYQTNTWRMNEKNTQRWITK